MPINKRNQDLLLVFDTAIAEKVGEWVKENPDTLEEAIARLELFRKIKKSGRGTDPYFALFGEIILGSRDPVRAGEIALETLIDYRKNNGNSRIKVSSMDIPRLQPLQKEEIPVKERCRKCNGTGIRTPRRNAYTCKYCNGTGRKPVRKRREKLINPFRNS